MSKHTIHSIVYQFDFYVTGLNIFALGNVNAIKVPAILLLCKVQSISIS